MYKQLLKGDYRKLAAKSNDAATGGGARDLRFPFKEFNGIFAELLPNARTEFRRRDGVRSAVNLRTGPVFIDLIDTDTGHQTTETAEMIWESPTDARGSEGRIAKVHASPATSQLLAARDDDLGEVFLLLVQDDDGELRVHYAYEKELRAGDWAGAVSDPVLKHLDGDRRQDRAVVGYIDFVTNFAYAHGAR
ncbi:hypothetical protein ACFDTO_00735 [Microbacteriaceae bacterium 4G12]